MKEDLCCSRKAGQALSADGSSKLGTRVGEKEAARRLEGSGLSDLAESIIIEDGRCILGKA